MKSISDMERQLAEQEATFAYHSAMHNHNFRSMDCTMTIVKIFNEKFTCSQTKCKSIITNITATQQVIKELRGQLYFSLDRFIQPFRCKDGTSSC